MGETLASLDEKACGERRFLSFYEETFAGLCRKINELFPTSCIGRPFVISKTGERYVEMSDYASFRDELLDAKVAEKDVVSRMCRRIAEYATEVADREGCGFDALRLYWRILPEEDTGDFSPIVKFDPDGPDVDPVTDKRCFVERGWKRYGIYMRFLLTNKPELTE